MLMLVSVGVDFKLFDLDEKLNGTASLFNIFYLLVDIFQTYLNTIYSQMNKLITLSIINLLNIDLGYLTSMHCYGRKTALKSCSI